MNDIHPMITVIIAEEDWMFLGCPNLHKFCPNLTKFAQISSILPKIFPLGDVVASSALRHWQ